MAKPKDIPTTDLAEIERLIECLKQGKLEQRDTQLLERLLRLLLSLIGCVPSVSRRAFEKKVCMVENSSQSDWYVIMIDRQWPNQMRFRKPIPPKSRI
jgi:hypothetical protein